MNLNLIASFANKMRFFQTGHGRATVESMFFYLFSFAEERYG